MTTTKNGAVLASVLAAAVALGASACSSSKDSKTANAGVTASGAAAADTCPNGGIRMGVEPYEDAAKLIPLYNKVAAALGAKLHCEVKVTIADSYVAEILAMKNGQLDLGEFGPLGYVFAKEQAGAIPLASFADAGGQLSSYTGGIWVKKGSPIASIADLAGHTLALSSPGSTSGDAIPRKALIDAGVDKKVTVQYAGGHTQSLLALTNGKVDAAEVNSQTVVSATAAGQFDASKYTQIFKSSPIANDPVTVSPKTSAAFQAAVKDALLGLTKDDVAGLGSELDFTPQDKPMIAVTDHDYQPVFDLAHALNLTTKDL
jgi:phosphonate transport system substrate-binding protein